MPRYIDADAELKRLPDDLPYKGSVKRVLMQAPAADVVEVVRCKDCKHNVANWQHDELDIEDYTDIVCDYFMTDGMEANDYCSYGERREE